MKIDYIDFFSRVIPEWMARSNQKSQEVSFGSDVYWLWGSIVNWRNLQTIQR